MKKLRADVHQKSFVGEDIRLDGYNWKDCTFTRCKIIMAKGDFSLINCRFEKCELAAEGVAVAILKVAKLFYPVIPLVDSREPNGIEKL